MDSQYGKESLFWELVKRLVSLLDKLHLGYEMIYMLSCYVTMIRLT